MSLGKEREGSARLLNTRNWVVLAALALKTLLNVLNGTVGNCRPSILKLEGEFLGKSSNKLLRKLECGIGRADLSSKRHF
jgi:hypothetical protein